MHFFKKTSRIFLCFVALALLSQCAIRTDLELVQRDLDRQTQELSQMQQHLAKLTIENQTLKSKVQQIEGQLVILEQGQGPILERLATIKSELDNNKVTQKPVTNFQVNSANEAYQLAVSDIEQGSFERAAANLARALERWPADKLVPNIQLLLSRVFYKQQLYIECIEQLLAIIEKYPEHPLAPAAYLLLSKALIQTNEVDSAQRILKSLIAQYPKSEEAQKAKDFLKTDLKKIKLDEE